MVRQPLAVQMCGKAVSGGFAGSMPGGPKETRFLKGHPRTWLFGIGRNVIRVGTKSLPEFYSAAKSHIFHLFSAGTRARLAILSVGVVGPARGWGDYGGAWLAFG